MSNASFQVPVAKNEPIKSYAPGSAERTSLKTALEQMASETVEIPLIIGGEEIRTGNTATIVMPRTTPDIKVDSVARLGAEGAGREIVLQQQ